MDFFMTNESLRGREMAKVKDLLPIGSVVLLEGGQKRVMIFGVKQTNRDDNQEYDYIGVMYPEGNVEEVGQFLFNHEDIVHIFFRGFEDPEREEFMEHLEEFYKNLDN